MLVGHCGSDWPNISISVNNTILFDQQVVDCTEFTCDVDPLEENEIVIQHYNKNNDTVVDDVGNITADRWCKLEYIKLNDLEFDLNFFSQYNFPYCTADGEILITNYFGKDGEFKFKFSTPLWKFWHECQQVSAH